MTTKGWVIIYREKFVSNIHTNNRATSQRHLVNGAIMCPITPWGLVNIHLTISMLTIKYSIRNKSISWLLMSWQLVSPGPINIKMLSNLYRKSHCGNKTIIWPSYLHNGISYTGERLSLYWIGAQVIRSHGIDYVAYMGPCHSWRRISTTCSISVSENDINANTISCFLKRKSADQWLNHMAISLSHLFNGAIRCSITP